MKQGSSHYVTGLPRPKLRAYLVSAQHLMFSSIVTTSVWDCMNVACLKVLICCMARFVTPPSGRLRRKSGRQEEVTNAACCDASGGVTCRHWCVSGRRGEVLYV